jgi:hypothetical protein
MRRACEATLSALLLAVTAIGAPGCLVVHLSPLYDDRSIEWDDKLLGTWESQEDRVTLVVTRSEWKSYGITWRDAFGEQRFAGHLTRLGQDRFVDVAPEPGVDRGPLLVVAHGSCWIELAGDTLTVAALDFDWLSARSQRAILPGHTFDERGNLLLTASTGQLRNWLQRNIARPQLFAPPMTFVRSTE